MPCAVCSQPVTSAPVRLCDPHWTAFLSSPFAARWRSGNDPYSHTTVATWVRQVIALAAPELRR